MIGIQIGEKEVKLTLLGDDMTVENPVESTKQQLEVICELSKTAGYKVSLQKSTVSVYQ